MATGTTVSILPCGAMTADLTWLLLAPGRAIRNRQNKHLPAEWVDVPTHCVLVDTPDGKLLWDTSCPRDWETRWAPTGLHDFFPYEKVSDDEYLDSRSASTARSTVPISRPTTKGSTSRRLTATRSSSPGSALSRLQAILPAACRCGSTCPRPAR